MIVLESNMIGIYELKGEVEKLKKNLIFIRLMYVGFGVSGDMCLISVPESCTVLWSGAQTIQEVESPTQDIKNVWWKKIKSTHILVCDCHLKTKVNV